MNQRRFILIGLSMIFILYFLLALYDYSITAKIPEECQSVNGLMEQENCMIELDAKTYTTLESCDLISNTEVTLSGQPRKDYCLRRFIESRPKPQPELCVKYASSRSRDECYTYYATSGYGKNWCDFVEKKAKKQACIEQTELQGY